ncbi:MAG: hypothetical protein H0T62_05045 [Parachlamydiaceae bacterium]|nr:hypothetical protein [Parachlamydiaceae bacterium]
MTPNSEGYHATKIKSIMRKCQELAAILAAEYAENRIDKYSPALILSLKNWSKKNESFRSSYSAGKLTIEAGSPLAQIYAICQLNIASKACHLADYLGESHPRFPLRPLWLKANIEIPLSPHMTLHLPDFMLAEDASLLLPRFCKRLLECGYNAILIGTQVYSKTTPIPSPQSTSSPDLKAMLQQFHDHGIKVILKPSIALDSHTFSFFEQKVQTLLMTSIDTLFQLFPDIDAFFWESLWQTEAYRSHATAFESTDPEIVLSEVRLLEKCLKKQAKLIFYLPNSSEKEAYQQVRWLPSLVDDMGPGSILAFNAVCGALYDDHENNHPLWNALRESPDTSATPLMPILNVGLIKQGEGLWPTTNFELIDRFLSRCYRHQFIGAIGLTGHLPQAGSVLDCNLWVLGQSLWRNLPVTLLAETWFKAFRPKENPLFCLKIMALARSIALDMSFLRANFEGKDSTSEPLKNEAAKIFGDSVLARLKQIKWLLDNQKIQKFSQTPSIKEHFPFFARDIKQLLTAFLPTFNLPLSHSMENDEPTSSFWKADLETPICGEKNSIMEVIFSQNHYL